MSAAPPSARSLFAAAREDGPSAAERDALFQQIALATGAGVATATAATASAVAPAAKAASAAAGAKLLFVGGLVVAVSSALGVVIALAIRAPEGSRPPDAPAHTSAPAERAARTHAATPGARPSFTASRRRDPSMDHRPPEVAAAAGEASATPVTRAPRLPDSTSELAEEARLVTEARAALVAGDPSRALTLIQATRKLSARALEPEELGLEARALHALGRADDAAATELVLRRRHPDHALAR